jgi:hypothetical protein
MTNIEQLMEKYEKLKAKILNIKKDYDREKDLHSRFIQYID